MLYLLVTGSRTWDDDAYIWSQLSKLYLQHGSIELHHGMCPEGGADLIADAWGNAFFFQGADVAVVRHPMDRHQFGKTAGPIRNTAMVNIFKGFINQGKNVACHAFHRNNSRGTSDCAYKALTAGIPVVTHVRNGDQPIKTVVEEQLVLFQDAA
jgi:hypothetical protein